MTTTTFDARLDAQPVTAPARVARPAKPTIARRIWNGLMDVGRKRAEREIGAYIQLRGGRVTDDLERSIERYCEMRGLR